MGRWRAVLFDLDGTLTDSAPALMAALNQVWAAEGRPLFDQNAVRSFVGDGPAVMIERARAASDLAADADVAARETQAFMTAYTGAGPGGDLYPGALDVVQGLRRAGYRLAVCTNKPQGAAEALLAAHGAMPFLDGIVGGDATPRRKPDPAHIQAALDQLGVPPADAVLVGDGPQDVAAAEAAGVDVIVAAYGYGDMAAARPDLPAIEDIRALPAQLAATN